MSDDGSRTADHPRDVWVDVTALGDRAPRRILAVDGWDVAIEDARYLYSVGRIDLDEFETRIAAAVKGGGAGGRS